MHLKDRLHGADGLFYRCDELCLGEIALLWYTLANERVLTMEFYEKLQTLRKQKGLTQEELAQKLYVSRTAISKWESGRGYPNIDSLKAIAACFSVTVDELLSGDEILSIAEQEQKQKKIRWFDWMFGLLNISTVLLFVLPWFGQRVEGELQEVPLWGLTAVAPYMRFLYMDAVCSLVLSGVLLLVLSDSRWAFWAEYKHRLSLLLYGIAILLFILGSQPYAAVLLFAFLSIQVLLLLKRG